jgi:8-oxo-dGTP pyrophosphatase MutT (NUDIX family)
MNDFGEIIERLRSNLAGVNCVPAVNPNGPSQAAVALVLRENLGQAEMLIIKRATRSGDHWSGNLAFPGGRWETHDENLMATAVRETHEEVGINLNSDGNILGALETITTVNPMIPKVQVAPFVAIAPTEFHILGPENTADAGMVLSDEVATAFWVPVQFLIQQGRSERFSLMYQGAKREWPAYPTEHGVIWGMTEGMVSEFLAILQTGKDGNTTTAEGI